MEAKTTTERTNTNVSLEQPRDTLSVWERTELDDFGLGRQMVTASQKHVNGLLTGKTIEELLPKSTRGDKLYDTFRLQKVNLGNCRQWSRHLLPAVRGERTDNPTGLSDIIIPVRQLDSGEAEEEISGGVGGMNERGRKEKDEKQLPKTDEQMQAGHLEDLENPSGACHTKIQDFDNLAVLTDENLRHKEKSVGRRALNWVDDFIRDHYRKKIAQTYKRELTEGHQFYPTTFYFIRPMTRAEREQQKRETYLCRDNLRQTIKGRFLGGKAREERSAEAERGLDTRRVQEEDEHVSRCKVHIPKQKL